MISILKGAVLNQWFGLTLMSTRGVLSALEMQGLMSALGARAIVMKRAGYRYCGSQWPVIRQLCDFLYFLPIRVLSSVFP